MVQRVTGGWATNSVIAFFPSNTPSVINGGFTLSASARSVVGSNGWVSNYLVAGSYRFSIDQSTRDYGVIYVPDTTDTLNLWSLTTSTNIGFLTNLSSFIRTPSGSGTSNVLEALRLTMAGKTNAIGWVWTATGTNGSGSWSNAASGSSYDGTAVSNIAVNAQATNASQQTALGFFTNHLAAPTNVWLFATSGSGTTNAPFIGWDRNIAWGPRTKYDFGGYVYSYTNSPNFGHESLELIGRGATLLYRGTGLASNAVSFISTNTHTYKVLMDDFFIEGATNATTGARVGLFVDGMHHGTFRNLRFKNVRQAGLQVNFAVCSLFDNIHVSGNWDFQTNTGAGLTWSAVPTNGLLLDGSWSCTYINPIIEKVSGIGFLVNTSHYSVFIGGTSEQNPIGLKIAGGGTGNIGNLFNGLAMELNTGTNIDVWADYTTFLNCYAVDGKVSRFIGVGIQLLGGEYSSIDLLNGYTAMTLERVRYAGITNNDSFNSQLTMRNCVSSTGGTGGNQGTNTAITTAFYPRSSTDPALIARGYYQSTRNILEIQDRLGATVYSAFGSNGWLSIGTSAPPSVALEVQGRTYSTTGFRVPGSSVNTYMQMGGTSSGIIEWDSNAVGQHYSFQGDSTGSGGPALLKFGNGAGIIWQSTARSDSGSTIAGVWNSGAGGVIMFGTASNLPNVSVSASNYTAAGSIAMSPAPFPTWMTNGLMGDWNSNGTWFRITSRRTGTNQTIAFVQAEP